MARSGPVNIPKRDITQLTNSDVAGDLSFQIDSPGYEVVVIGSVDATEPGAEDIAGGITFTHGQGHTGPISDLFPGAGFVRLWAYCHNSGADVIVYHA